MKKRYAIHGERSYCEIVTSEYLPDDKVLRIEYVSDGPSEESLKKFIKDTHPELVGKEIERIYSDRPWLYTKSGVPYALILIFFK